MVLELRVVRVGAPQARVERRGRRVEVALRRNEGHDHLLPIAATAPAAAAFGGRGHVEHLVERLRSEDVCGVRRVVVASKSQSKPSKGRGRAFQKKAPKARPRSPRASAARPTPMLIRCPSAGLAR